MTEEREQNAVTPIPESHSAVAPFQFMETRPSGITWHMIFDHELDYLTNISRPIVLGLSTTFLGSVIGMATNAIDVLRLIRDHKVIGYSDATTLILFGLCLAATIILGYFAVMGQLDAIEKKREIRSRRAVAINPLDRQAQSPISDPG